MKKVLMVATVVVLLLPMSLFTAASAPLVPLGKISTPESAAKKLYSAWKKHDRSAARLVASNSAVNQLFKTRFTGDAPDWQFQGCEKRRGGYNCSFSYEGGGVTMRVAGGASAGYRVTSVSFIAD